MLKFKPMLAVNSKPSDLVKPQMGSLKLEGVRFEVVPENGLCGRSLKPFNNSLLYAREDVQALARYCKENDIYIEGEMYVHGWSFNRIDSCIRGEGNIDACKIEFHVFDCFVSSKSDATFKERYNFYKYVCIFFEIQGLSFLKAVEQVEMQAADDILAAYCWAIENGYEGFCLKAKDLPYKHGRSTLKQEYFTRIKPEDTYDCIVLEIIERKTNLCDSERNELGYLKKKQDKSMKAHTGMAQTALVYTPQINAIHKVSLTRGLTDPDRMRIWEDEGFYVGKCMQFVGIPVPAQKVPRSPRFDKWRHDITPAFLTHDASDALFVSWDVADTDGAIESGCDVITFPQFLSLINQGYAITENSN